MDITHCIGDGCCFELQGWGRFGSNRIGDSKDHAEADDKSGEKESHVALKVAVV